MRQSRHETIIVIVIVITIIIRNPKNSTLSTYLHTCGGTHVRNTERGP